MSSASTSSRKNGFPRLSNDELAGGGVEWGPERPLEEFPGFLVAERVQLERLSAAYQVRSLRPRRRQEQYRPADFGQHQWEEIDQGIRPPSAGPRRRRTKGRSPASSREQAHPLLLQALPGCAGVEVAGDVEPECEREDPALAESGENGVSRVLLAQSELGSEHVGERAVGHAATVREAAANPEPRLMREPHSELPDEARLAHPRSRR